MYTSMASLSMYTSSDKSSFCLPKWYWIKGRSGPNRSALPLGPLCGSFMVGTWNCRGLFIGNPAKRALSLYFLGKLAKKGHILCLQETYGLPYEVLTELCTLLAGWLVQHSSCHDVHGLDAGGLVGVAILSCPKIVEFCDIKHTVLVPGRVHKVTCDFCCGQFVRPSQVSASPDRCFEIFNARNSGHKKIDII